MKMLLALTIALLALMPADVGASPSGQAHAVSISEPATAAAGQEAVFTVTATGPAPSSLNLVYEAEGGEVRGILSLNESGPGEAQAMVYVQRMTPGEAVLIASLAGIEVARGTATFVPSAAPASGPGDSSAPGVAPFPPATGNGQVETPVLSETQTRQLFGLFLTVVVAMGVGTLVVRVLAHIAPVRRAGKRD